MAFNNRWICKYDDSFSFDEIKEDIVSNHFFVENTNLNSLKHKIEVHDEYNSEELNFIYGKYGYEYETNTPVPKITEEKIYDTGDLIVQANTISFWIADNNFILFSLKDMKSKNNFAENILTDESSIRNVDVDIKKMHEDVEKGKLSDMWASAFKNRDSNVNKASFYGVHVNDDPIYSATKDAPRNFVGIMKDVGDEKIKIKLTKDGSFQILCKQLNPLDCLPFVLISDLEEYMS